MKSNTYILIFLLIFLSCNKIFGKNFYDILGIDSFNTNFFTNNDKQPNSPIFSARNSVVNNIALNIEHNISRSFNEIDELINFLKSSKMKEEVAIKIISRFLIADNCLIHKNCCVFDRTGFDGLPRLEQIEKINQMALLEQKARSAAKIYFNINGYDNSYDAYDAKLIKSENNISGWNIFKVILLGSSSNHKDNQKFVKVCLPSDENFPALVLEDLSEKCDDKVYKMNILKT